jgi:Fe2+ or Zn2+ uptake regulation protein
MNFSEHLAADQRLVILRLLVESNSYKANSSVLTMRMDHLGHAVSRDVVRSHLSWLDEQGLVSIDEPVTGVVVATLRPRGDDVARGRAVVPGVSRPGA